jgi:cytochrome c oxidase subunit 2
MALRTRAIAGLITLGTLSAGFAGLTAADPASGGANGADLHEHASLSASHATIETGAALQAAGAPRVIEITAERFEFWPSQVTVNEGEHLEFRLRSDDTLHGFRLVGTGTNITIPKRGKGIVTARVAGLKPGRYTFECSRLCGAGHNFMRGTLIVRASAPATP